MPSILIQGLTWRGQPHVQQDVLLVDGTVYQHANGCTRLILTDAPVLVAVADGLASSPHSEQASHAILTLAQHQWQTRQQPLDLPQMQEQLSALFGPQPELHGSSCTYAGLMLWPDQAMIQHLGDSRVYHWSARQRQWHPCTEDHTVIRRMIAEGDAVPADQQNCGRLYESLDLCFVVDPLEQLPDLAAQRMNPEPGDYVLLCTDGVHDLVPASDWPAPDHHFTLKDFLLQLRRQVYAASAYDNGTAVLVHIDATRSTT